MGDKFHLKLNIGERPIANKYREGKMKRTLKRELNKYLKLLRGKRYAFVDRNTELSMLYAQEDQCYWWIKP